MNDIERKIRNLGVKICCLLDAPPITNANYVAVRKRYESIVDEIGNIPFYKDKLASLKKAFDKLSSRFCCNDVIPLTNEEGDSDLAYPLAVLNVNGVYLGIANDSSEYIALWNADFDNQAVGTITGGSDTSFKVQLVDNNSSIALTALEFYTITSNNANSIMHVDDNDIVVYGAGTAVRGLSGTVTASSAVDVYNGTFGVQVETPFNVRRVTTVNTAGDPVRVLHSRVSTRIGMNTLTDCKTLTGVLPKACITLGLRVTLSTDLVSGVSNWSELQSIESWTVMGLGGGVYNITTPAFIPQPPPSVKALALRDIGPEPLATLTSFTWLTFSALPNLRRLFISMNGGDMVGTGISFFTTMPRVDKQLTITNNNGTHASATNSDLCINRVAAALISVTPVAPKTIRLEDTTARTAASTAASTQLTTATWSVTYT